MQNFTRDPLLMVAKAITWFLIAVMGFAAGFIILATPFVPFNHGRIIAELSAKGVTAGPEFTATLTIMLLFIAGLLIAAIWFVRLLQKMINSVEEGDPFAPVNADRLNRMAWISLSIFIASFPIGAMVAWVANIAADAGENVNAEVDFGGGALLLSVVLFILARVFRHGAAMREDLEGTV